MTRKNGKQRGADGPAIATGADSVSDYGRHGNDAQRRRNRMEARP